ncbi:MAG: hypothetical protein PHR78_05835 [Eubacteriales bacterium]|nr:hypothetical protein [Eubacteriales bacterium]
MPLPSIHFSNNVQLTEQAILIDDSGLEYYIERAKGGTGALILGFQNVSGH